MHHKVLLILENLCDGIFVAGEALLENGESLCHDLHLLCNVFHCAGQLVGHVGLGCAEARTSSRLAVSFRRPWLRLLYWFAPACGLRPAHGGAGGCSLGRTRCRFSSRLPSPSPSLPPRHCCCPSACSIGRSKFVRQTITISSEEADAKKLPSGAKATELASSCVSLKGRADDLHADREF